MEVVLVMQTVMDVQNGVGLMGTIGRGGNRGRDPSQC